MRNLLTTDYMKVLLGSLVFVLVCLTAGAFEVFSQDKLIILVRHAEKAVLESEQDPDPELSDAGRERAMRFRKVIGRYRPGAFYSTNYKRTRDTIIPLAEKRGKEIKIYDPRNPKALFDEIMSSKTKRFVVVGHSNTIPGLANLIGKHDIFKNLNESEYSVIWLIRIDDGKVKKITIVDY